MFGKSDAQKLGHAEVKEEQQVQLSRRSAMASRLRLRCLVSLLALPMLG
jgi:hypothetical protein